MPRSDEIVNFLNVNGWSGADVSLLAGDASFRRYDRITLGNKKAVLMDAPPVFEDTRPFVAVAEFLLKSGLHAPKIFAKDFEKGFLLIEDLGDDLFKRVLDVDPGRELELYRLAIDELIKLNACSVPESLPYGDEKYNLPLYDTELMLEEVSLFTDWYYPALTGKRLPFDKRKNFLSLWKDVLGDVTNTSECLVLRDYHAENLLERPDGQVGQLDFQDAVIGHSAYDLVSLLQDARRDVDPQTEKQMIDYFVTNLGREKSKFYQDYMILGAQRNIKIIGIFARLFLRDGKDNYLKLQPRVWGLLERCLEHPVLNGLKEWFDLEVPSKRDVPLDAINLKPGHSIILAAGLGSRMAPLTDHKPKPLIEVAGKAMLGHTLDKVAAAGIKNTVVNKHHHADQIDQYLNERKDWRPKTDLSDESDLLLDSGGGVKKALLKLGSDPFFILNSDMIWKNDGQDALSRLATIWSDNMDILMLLVERGQAYGHDGPGDFEMQEDGRLKLRGDADFASYFYGGILIIRPECFLNTPDGPFSLREIFSKVEKEQRLFGLPHDGEWYHVGTPDAIGETERLLIGK